MEVDGDPKAAKAGEWVVTAGMPGVDPSRESTGARACAGYPTGLTAGMERVPCGQGNDKYHEDHISAQCPEEDERSPTQLAPAVAHF